jgi:murein DD-endopeptidase MepM/ murein hydrolase activator NlpD
VLVEIRVETKIVGSLMMDFDEYYDALIKRIKIIDQGNQVKYIFVLWALALKVVGLFLILIILVIVSYQLPVKLIFENEKKTEIPPVFVADIGIEETMVPTGTVLPASLPNDITPEVVVNTPTIVPTISRFDPSDASQNVEIGIPLSGFTAEELPLIVTQAYNVPNEFRDAGHHGVDFAYYDYKGQYILNLPINAVFAGQVAGIIHNRPPLGYAVMVETPYDSLPEVYRQELEMLPDQSLYILYAHMIEAPRYEVGDPIAWQQQLGNVGKSQTAEAHLHFETRIGQSGFTFENMAYYDTSATEEEMETYLTWRTSGKFHPFDPMKLFTEMYQN